MTDHDQLFKKLIKTFFDQFLEIVIPQLAHELDITDVKFLDKETFASVYESDRAIVDLVAEVTIRGGGTRLLLIHIEVEGVFRHTLPERLWYYFMHLRLTHRVPVIPVALCLKGGPPGLDRGTLRDEVLGTEICRFHYFTFSLSGSQAEDYLDRPEPLAAGLAALMRPTTMDAVEHKLRCMRAIAQAHTSEREEILLFDLVETYIRLNEEDTRRYAERLAAEANEEVKTMALTYLGEVEAKALEQGMQRGMQQGMQQGMQRGMQRGMQQGMQQGIEQGALQAARRIVTHEMERRFGPLAPALRERVEALQDLGAYERLLDAESLAELEAQV